MGKWDPAGRGRPAGVGNTLSDVAGAAVQAGSIGGDVVIHHHGDRPRQEVPDQLPGPTARFVNRSAEFDQLDELLAGGPPVVVISGLPGVGKSALACTWGTRRRGDFPDGRLYVDFGSLRTAEGTAVGDGLAEVLRSLGVADTSIPATLSGRAALLRTKMAARRCLIVLDDVAEPAHVQPFVSPAGGCVVVATSNGRLVELTLDGAREIRLQPLASGDAVQLLRELCGDDRVRAEDESARELARLCEGFPVALRVVAARLLARPHMALAELVAELSDDARRLSALAVRGVPVVSAVFDNAYRALPARSAKLYRRLGLLPLLDFPQDVVALLERDGTVLDALVDANLLDEVAPGRFAFPSLVGLHAREKAVHEPPRDRDELLRLVLHHYLARVDQADRVVMRDRLRVARLGHSAAEPFPGRQSGLDWLAAERANLLALVRAAATGGHDDVAWMLAELLTALYFNRRYVEDWIESAALGAQAARRAGNAAAEARLRSMVSRAYTDLGMLDRADEELRIARELSASAGNQTLIASVWEFTGRYLEHVDVTAAIEAYRNALSASLAVPEPRGAALAKYFLGGALHSTGQTAEGLAMLTDAHRELVELHDPRMSARVLISLASVRRSLGDLGQARDDAEQAAAVFRESRAAHYEAQALVVLADVLEALGDHDLAQEKLRRAIELREADGTDAADLRARLDS